jgi:hypothetical protein
MHFLVSVFATVLAVVPASAQIQMPEPAPVSASNEVQMPAVAWQAAPLPDVKPVQVPLTPEIIERYIASLPDLISLARELDQELGRSEQLQLKEDLAFLLVPHLFDPRVESRITGHLNELGFASYSEWANTAHSVAIAVESAEFTGSIDLAEQESALRRDIESSPLSPDEKTKALEDLKSKFAALAEFEPLPGNREAAAPYLERLRAATGG